MGSEPVDRSQKRLRSIWLLFLIGLPCGYVAGYFLLLDPTIVLDESRGGIGVGYREANYRMGGGVARFLFTPLHSVDRFARPDLWKSYSTLDDAVLTSGRYAEISNDPDPIDRDQVALDTLIARGVIESDSDLGIAIDFDGIEPTDDDLLQLRRISELRELTFGGWATPRGPTDDQLVFLSELIQLRHLSLNNTKITDDGIKHLLQLPNLEFLDLSHMPISYDSLAQILRSMPKLKWLYIEENPNITVELRIELEKLRPKCQVIR